MVRVQIPGWTTLTLEHLVLDYNGTLACDGELADGVAPRLQRLSRQLQVHVVTADTFGKVQASMEHLPCRITVLPADDQPRAKAEYVQALGPERTACMGNGRNDRLMLERAALGIVVLHTEGAAGVSVAAADVVCTAPAAGLDLLLHPMRLAATLRV